MKTRDALRAMSGQDIDYCDGPLGKVAADLLAAFRDEEAARLEDANVRAALVGTGPMLRALAARFAATERDALIDNSLPAVSRFDAYQTFKSAKKADPKDRGVKIGAAHLERLWYEDPTGYLTVGDLARFREHYASAYPKSKIAHIVDTEIPGVGFQTLNLRKLSQLAEFITGDNDAEIQAAYENVVRAHGLDGNKPEQLRARAFLRSVAELQAEVDADAGFATLAEVTEPGHVAATKRLSERMAAHSDPILARIGQLGDELGEEEIPHDEGTEEMAEIESPITGEPLALELGMQDEALPEAEPALPPPAEEPEPELQHMGQLEDFAPMPEPMDEPGTPTTTIIEDPSAPGEELEVTLAPVESEAPEAGEQPGAGSLAPTSMPSDMTLGAYKVYAVRGGKQQATPLEVLRAKSMAEALGHVAQKLREADGNRPTPRDVVAHEGRFEKEAAVLIDDESESYLRVIAEEDPMSPEVVTEGQPTVRHNMDIDPDEGLKVLTEEPSLKQNAPKPIKAKALSRAEVVAICKKLGLTADRIEAKLLDGEAVTAAGWTIRTDDYGDVALGRGGQFRTASLIDLDRVIADFQAGVAYASRSATAPATTKRTASRGPSYELRPLFSIGCVRCGSVEEYIMPDDPVDVRCGTCTHVTPKEAVAVQLEARHASAFPGYWIRADVPGPNHKTNARRLLRAIQQVAPDAVCGLRGDSGKPSIVVEARGANDATIARIQRVLEDRFGVAAQINANDWAEESAMEPAETGTACQQEFMEDHAGKPKAPKAASVGLYAIHYKAPDGSVRLRRVEAASADTAHDTFRRFHPGIEVLHVEAQEALMPEAPPPPPPPPEQAMVPTPKPLEAPPGGEDVAGASLNSEAEDAIRSAMTHYRNTGVGIASAIDSFNSSYKKFLDQWGDASSPSRHLAEAAIVRIAKEVFEKPALIETRMAQKGPAPKSINEQQDPWVDVGTGDAILGPDSSTDESANSALDAPEINEQVDPIAEHGLDAADPDNWAPESESHDPGTFGADKPPSDGHVTFDGPGWGQSWSDTDLGEDSSTGENKTTKEWSSISDKAEPGRSQ